jgi:hypothetical protein
MGERYLDVVEKPTILVERPVMRESLDLIDGKSWTSM